MDMRNRLVKNFSWSFMGGLIYAFTQWLMLIIITRVGSAYDAGIYSLGLAISAPFVLLLNLNFTALQSTDLTVQYGFDSFKRIRIFGNASFILILALDFHKLIST
jgi:O-antigen/teichoic acid export membrane protein